ncbi:MAG: hypothetical protein ABIH83_00355 [Candidatus Micrarchaeota archaeon]
MDILGLAKKARKEGAVLNRGKDLTDLCPACKRNGRIYCPHKPMLAIKAELAREFDKQDFFGPSPPNLFVGEYNYPNITWGPAISLAEGIPDNPKYWYGWGFDAIVRARSMQIRGKAKSTVSAAKIRSPGLGREEKISRMLLDAQESSMSSVPVDLEAHFSKKPNLQIQFYAISQPTGPSAPMEKLKIVDNPKIPGKVDELVEEGINASNAIRELTCAGFDEHYLTRLLTCGVLGNKKRRKLVPTKWGITAIDDMIAKQNMEKIRDFSENSKYLFYQNEYLANRFSILLLPGAWEYENFEAWCGSSGRYAISEEYESYWGRSEYAFSQGGGYYAARFAVCEALASKIRRQARVVVIREIMPEYDLPCGVWVLRQTVREAFRNSAVEFSSFNEMIEYIKPKLKIPFSKYLSKSTILRQRRLSDF